MIETNTDPASKKFQDFFYALTSSNKFLRLAVAAIIGFALSAAFYKSPSGYQPQVAKSISLATLFLASILSKRKS